MDIKDVNTEVGNRIYERRRSLGYTRERLSELADISVQFLADIEKGRKSMTVNTLRRIAAALSVSADYIVNGEDEKQEKREKSAIAETLNTLSPYHRSQAERLLNLFAETIAHDKSD